MIQVNLELSRFINYITRPSGKRNLDLSKGFSISKCLTFSLKCTKKSYSNKYIVIISWTVIKRFACILKVQHKLDMWLTWVFVVEYCPFLFVNKLLFKDREISKRPQISHTSEARGFTTQITVVTARQRLADCPGVSHYTAPLLPH